MITQGTVYPDFYRQNGKQVKNLGWILRNWKNIKEFRVYTKGLTNPCDDALLTAKMTDGRVYEAGFASKTMLRDFLQRPIFYGLPLNWDGTDTEIKRRPRACLK